MANEVETDTPEFPPDLRQYPEIIARELYIHRVVNKKPAAVFFQEQEGGCAARAADIVYFFAQAAAVGVMGNVAYDALASAVRAIRKPSREVPGHWIKFDFVISRKTYNRERRQRHRGKRGKATSSKFETELRKCYSLMVSLQPISKSGHKSRRNLPKRS